MNDFFSFFLFPNVWWALAGVLLICLSASAVGVFALLRRQALIGDAISHAILPGICLAFLIAQSKQPLILLTGACISGWLGLLIINYLTANTRIKGDAALGLVLSVFYGIGILLLTAIQRSGNASQSGLDRFLFGKAAALMPEDVQVFGAFSLLLLLVIMVLQKPLALILFDREYALSRGMPVRQTEGLLSILTVLAIALGIQAAGVVLMAALLIAPGAAARYWTHSLQRMLLLAGLFAALAGFVGTYISWVAPRMPTGPWIVQALTLIVFISLLFGSRKGLVAAWIHKQRNIRKMTRENLLKCLYQLGESDGKFDVMRNQKELALRRPDLQLSGSAMSGLIRGGMIRKSGTALGLTGKGVEEGRRIVRIHRLWELYLTTHLQLPADHVHEDAEAIEHVITPEIEAQLISKLAQPLTDPHLSPIPYSPGLPPNF